jgi:hypothetical protein
MKKNETPVLKVREVLFQEVWLHDLSGAYTNAVTKDVLSDEEFEKYRHSSSCDYKILTIGEKI